MKWSEFGFGAWSAGAGAGSVSRARAGHLRYGTQRVRFQYLPYSWLFWPRVKQSIKPGSREMQSASSEKEPPRFSTP